MKTFNQFLQNEEVQWTKSLFDHLFVLDHDGLGGHALARKISQAKKTNPNAENMDYVIPEDAEDFLIPLVPSMIERVVGSVVTYGIHASDAGNLENLIKLQGKKTKQISVFTTDENGELAYGIWGGGGVYSVCKGNVYAGASADLMSVVDKQGRRLINLAPGTDFADNVDYEEIFSSSDFRKLWADLKRFRGGLVKKLVPIGKKTITDSNLYVNHAIDSSKVSGSVKSQFIKQYIDGVEKLLVKHSKVFARIYISWARKQSKKWNFVAGSYDEMVMGNFEILKVYVTEQYQEEFIIHFANIPDDEWFQDGFVAPTWDSIKSKVGFKFPVEFITQDNAEQILPKFLKGLKK